MPLDDALERTAVVVPGRNFGPYVPQLFLPMVAAFRRGARPVTIEWEHVSGVDALDRADVPGWVNRQVAPHLEGRAPESTLLIGKSLGSHAAASAADAAVPAIWVTPLLTNESVVAALRAMQAPFLLVGGTADPFWDGVLARSLTPYVCELPGADHGLFVDEPPLSRSVDNLGALADAAEAFIDEHVWLSGSSGQ